MKYLFDERYARDSGWAFVRIMPWNQEPQLMVTTCKTPAEVGFRAGAVLIKPPDQTDPELLANTERMLAEIG